MPTQKLTAQIIIAAIDGLEVQKKKIDVQIAELKAMLPRGAAPESTATASPKQGRRKRSAAVRRRMAEAQKRRWAAIKGETEPVAPATTKAPKPKRRISPEGMKRIIAATKKRWRLQKAAANVHGAKKAATKKAA